MAFYERNVVIARPSYPIHHRHHHQHHPRIHWDVRICDATTRTKMETIASIYSSQKREFSKSIFVARTNTLTVLFKDVLWCQIWTAKYNLYDILDSKWSFHICCLRTYMLPNLSFICIVLSCLRIVPKSNRIEWKNLCVQLNFLL